MRCYIGVAGLQEGGEAAGREGSGGRGGRDNAARLGEGAGRRRHAAAQLSLERQPLPQNQRAHSPLRPVPTRGARVLFQQAQAMTL